MTSRTFGVALAISAAAALGAAGSASAQTTTANGAWTAYPGQTTISETAVQQPINADGSSNFKANGKGVIPIKFSLRQGLGAFAFDSIYSDDDTETAVPGTPCADELPNNCAFLTFTPSGALNFADVATLASNYAFADGDCHGGSLRWSVRVSPTQSVFIYYGTSPSFATCTGGASQSGLNMIGLPDLRYDTSQVGGTFYDTYANAVALVGDAEIVRASLVLDSGWGGDQSVTLTSATVNNDTFVPPPATTPAPTCDLPPATIRVTKVAGAPSGQVNEPVTIQPGDSNGAFRVVDCKYMYNLATSSLSGVGTYTVEALIGGTPATNPAVFELK